MTSTPFDHLRQRLSSQPNRGYQVRGKNVTNFLFIKVFNKVLSFDSGVVNQYVDRRDFAFHAFYKAVELSGVG